MSEPRRPDQVERFFGMGLVAVGALIFALCGLCTLNVVGSSLSSMARTQLGPELWIANLLFGAAIVTIFGGLPMALGFLVARFGWQMYRGRPSRPPTDE